jgi:hypothetical protein
MSSANASQPAALRRAEAARGSRYRGPPRWESRLARRRLTKQLRKTKDHQAALRILMILKLGQGLSRKQVARDLHCAPATVVGAARRYLELGEDGLLDQRAGNGQTKADERFLAELRQVLLSVPTEFEELMLHVIAFMRAYNQKKKLNPSLEPAAAVAGSRSAALVLPGHFLAGDRRPLSTVGMIAACSSTAPIYIGSYCNLQSASPACTAYKNIGDTCTYPFECSTQYCTNSTGTGTCALGYCTAASPRDY